MKIGFDAKRITHNKTGLGNYSRYIVNILSAFYPDNSYELYSPGEGNPRLHALVKETPSVQFHYPSGLFTWIPTAFWRSFALTSVLKEDSVGLFHGLSNELPYGLKSSNIKSVVTIHDLIFLRYPQFYRRIDRVIYTNKFRKACKEADCIIAISEMTKRDIIRFFNIDADKIHVIYQGCDLSFTHPAEEERKALVRSAYNLPKRYILNVGSIEKRKNLLLVIKALKQVDEDVSLVAIGKRTEYTDQLEKYIMDNDLSKRVRLLDGVPFEDLPAIYQQASLFVYPSFFEGFGIPIIEALHSGIPVIAATGSCLEEAGGPDSIYVNPNNESDMAQSINSVLSSPVLAEKMIKAGKEYVQNFSDKTIARQLMELYKGLL
ncbi:glycosyltransferase family 4 protein [Parabacteroides bouchesdurhonensis]|uniref:glycosyltransferase family 4 protein n=1 Tax=Parabacteroides bouchesdurhonensis TaxID=1936995 RepID=UPI000C83E300|nr:glycosyltransferase family 1 protein [Parabacteroides bouchesdurhonensis]